MPSDTGVYLVCIYVLLVPSLPTLPTDDHNLNRRDVKRYTPLIIIIVSLGVALTPLCRVSAAAAQQMKYTSSTIHDMVVRWVTHPHFL